MFKRAWSIIVFCFRVATMIAAAGFWILHALRYGQTFLSAWWRVRNMHAGSTVRCSACHQNVETVGRWTCSLCRATYDGSVWRCGRPSCRAVTPYISCNCGHFIDNPFLTEVH